MTSRDALPEKERDMSEPSNRSVRQILLAATAIAAVLMPSSVLVAEQFGTRQMGGVGVTVYEDTNFRGRSATFRNDTPDVGRAAGLNDRISSLRVARGEYWEACEHINYGGRCQVFSGDEARLSNGWNDESSSFRRVRGGGGGGFRPPFGGGNARGRVVLYDERRFRGRSVMVNGVEGYLANFNDRAESVQVIGGGAWELCEDSEFRGRCVTVTSDRPDLGNLRGKVSSVRPARRF